MGTSTTNIVNLANKLIHKYGTRDPWELADALGIYVMPRQFHSQRGAYKVILNNRFIFLKDDMNPILEKIVLLHEIGHDQLHRKAAVQSGGFQEFNIFDMRDNRLEYEANVFSSQLSLPDDEILELIETGYDIQQIAGIMKSDINLVALKNDTLISQGYLFRQQTHHNDFLRYDKKIF